MDKYSYHEYEITECDGEQLPAYCTDLEPKYQRKWVYTIFSEYTDYESDEWYDSFNDAELACKEKIDILEDGDVEPDYEARPYFEQSPEWWEERRKLGE